MAADTFTLQTFDGSSDALGLSFDRSMLSGSTATELPPERLEMQGTTVRLQSVRNKQTYDVLIENFPHWLSRCQRAFQRIPCLMGRELHQPGSWHMRADLTGLQLRSTWVERARPSAHSRKSY